MSADDKPAIRAGIAPLLLGCAAVVVADDEGRVLLADAREAGHLEALPEAETIKWGTGSKVHDKTRVIDVDVETRATLALLQAHGVTHATIITPALAPRGREWGVTAKRSHELAEALQTACAAAGIVPELVKNEGTDKAHRELCVLGLSSWSNPARGSRPSSLPPPLRLHGPRQLAPRPHHGGLELPCGPKPSVAPAARVGR